MRNVLKTLVTILLTATILPLSNFQTVEATTDSNVNEMIPEWAIELFDEKAQNNSMLERAWEDYLELPEIFQLADLTTMAPGTSYSEVLDTFDPGDDVEVAEYDGGDGTASISYVYRAEEGDINEENGLEDWAQVDFYFVSDNLIYTGVNTLSLSFFDYRLVPSEEHHDFASSNVDVEDLMDNDVLELSSYGQILVDGDYAHGIGYPKEGQTLGEGGLLIIQDEEVTGELTVPFEELMAYSFSGYAYLMLVTQVENAVFGGN